jgi:MFS family permease
LKLVRRLRDLAVDVTPLRASRDFRLLYAGIAVSQFGSQFTAVAIPVLLYRLTDSALSIGLFGLITFPTLLICNVLGGATADKFERRRVVVLSELVGLASVLGLAVNMALPHPYVAPLYVLGALNLAAFSVGAPAHRSAIPLLVDRELIASAMALKAVSGSLAHVAGPALAGVLLVVFDPSVVFIADAATFGIAVLCLLRMQRLPVADEVAPTFTMVREGLAHLRRQPILLGAFASDLNAMVFGMPAALFPAVADERFAEHPTFLGLLYAAPFVGSGIASVASGWTRHLVAHGRVVVLSVIGWGAAITLFGLVDGIGLSLAALVLAGAADMISGISRQAILALATPPELLGRMEGAGMAVWTSGPRLGDAEAGVAAAVGGVDFAIVSGGLLCIATMLVLAKALPGFAAFRDESAPIPAPAPT